MKLVLNNGFCEMTQNEVMEIDGGVDWYSIGMGVSMTAGGFIGGAIGSCVGPAARTIIGSAIGGVIYSIGK